MFSAEKISTLKKLGLTILFVVVLCPAAARAANAADCEIDERFGANERRILAQACRLAVERMQSREIRDEVNRRAGYSYLSDSVMTRSHARETSQSRWNLLWRQLATLAAPNGPNDEGPAFPNVYIMYGNEAPRGGGQGWLGRAYLDLVTVYWDSEQREWKQRGSFALTINDYFVARGRRYSDPNDWAGTIAHEMLHNLGHRHPDSSNPDYHKYQINVLDALVQNYGSDLKGERWSQVSEHDCGAEEIPAAGGRPVRININGRVVTID